jgi:hypothetical protein
MRTMVTTATTEAVVVVFQPAGLSPAVGDRALAQTLERINLFARS